MLISRKMLITLLSAILSAVLVYGLYLIQSERIQAEEQVQVVVPNQWIEAGHMITTDQLKLLSMPISLATVEMVFDITDVIGQEAVVPLGSDEPILQWKLNRYALHPNEQEATFQIPKDYIKSISNGIRAGDAVWIYSSGEEAIPTKIFQQDIVVASVKTGSNLEVDAPDEDGKNAIVRSNAEQMYASRRVANGMIEYINVNLTEEQWLYIDNLCRTGDVKLVIAYHSLPQLVKGQINDE
ncbi:SAF domain-containing protein [Paenibacillus endoradicis]|uniref:SAF domain-containing protein n=1 Tax=Paenibacillus endoradicis TaxID=2972487 RepID=UPI002158DD97|nr:SAF domain-containing protein [Paenibacillus endoradicis]MCR8657066.1 flagellar biosynthesis protein FlgA [Paenibacillus endoradicis]